MQHNNQGSYQEYERAKKSTGEQIWPRLLQRTHEKSDRDSCRFDCKIGCFRGAKNFDGRGSHLLASQLIAQAGGK
jgi:hypothetical protein